MSDERLLVALHMHQRAATIIQGVGVVGGERQRLVVIGQSLFITPEFGQRAAAVVEYVGVARAQLRGPVEKGQSQPCDRRDGSSPPPSGTVPGVEKVWVRLQRHLAKSRGRVDIPTFESGDRALEKFPRR